MATFEKELKRFIPAINKISHFSLLGKKIEITGQENFVREGGNIIIGNHLGSFKDIAVLFKSVPRPMFFTANQMIFSRKDFSTLVRRHLRRHLKRFGLFVDFLINPIKFLFVDYISSNIAKIGTIPVDMYSGKRTAIKKCQEYVKLGRAIVALQGRGRVMSKDSNPYVHPFRRGAAIIAYNLYKEEKISVPVTPIAMFGTHRPLFVPGTIHIKVGKPMFITDYWEEDEKATIEHFRNALESRVKSMILEILRSRHRKK